MHVHTNVVRSIEVLKFLDKTKCTWRTISVSGCSIKFKTWWIFRAFLSEYYFELSGPRLIFFPATMSAVPFYTKIHVKKSNRHIVIYIVISTIIVTQTFNEAEKTAVGASIKNVWISEAISLMFIFIQDMKISQHQM